VTKTDTFHASFTFPVSLEISHVALAININTSNCSRSGLLHSLWDNSLVLGHARRLSALANLTNVAHSLHPCHAAPVSHLVGAPLKRIETETETEIAWHYNFENQIQKSENRCHYTRWANRQTDIQSGHLGVRFCWGVVSFWMAFMGGYELLLEPGTNELWSALYAGDFVAFCRRCFMAPASWAPGLKDFFMPRHYHCSRWVLSWVYLFKKLKVIRNAVSSGSMGRHYSP